MRYKDFTSYTLVELPGNKIGQHIGWLDHSVNFPKGSITPLAMEKLESFCLQPFVRFRHFDGCPLCPKIKVHEYLGGKKTLLGTAHVAIEHDDIFVFPDLVYHYILRHNYLPPNVFITALCHGKCLAVQE